MSKAAISRPRVYVRIRPLNEREKVEGNGELWCHVDKRQPDVLVLKKDDGKEVQTRFDYVFGMDAAQNSVFERIGPEVLETLFGGYNASVFAYGQTGSGKTHTMEGERFSDENGGLIPRLIRSIFDRFKVNPDISDAVCEMSFVQIYQEKIQDLLNARKQLEIHMDRTGQYVAKEAVWRRVVHLEDCMNLYAEAAKMRAVSATEMNLVSSRSHMILMLRLQWDEPSLPGSKAQLNMIDLAGSERIAHSGATGETMKEAIHINKSLSALGNVVSKLVDQAKYKSRRIHVPYKDSKLTYLLQSSLGGSNLVHFVLAVSGSAMWRSETTSTIEFGKRALQLVLRPVRNAIDYTRLAEMEEMIERMRSHIASLEEELRNRRSSDAAGFLQMQRIMQDDDVNKKNKKSTMKDSSQKARLKIQAELSRIMENLPEAFEDLTSHCVLFPESKGTFREMEGLQRLVYYVDKSASTFYRANAAHTIASVIDEAGREMFSSIDGLQALTRLLLVNEERCKEAACVALEAVCRGCQKNKMELRPEVYEELVALIHGYPNQQVQVAACAAVAAIVDLYSDAKRICEALDIVPKLLETIRNTPKEVVDLTKAATNCVGRLAHGDTEMQDSIASMGGIDLLTEVLFSAAGERDHQVPILASYALVNLCCSNAGNLEIAQEHPHYNEIKYRLLEGLARAFGNNTIREGFGRATAQETSNPFPYFGVTVVDKWTSMTSGGRPIFSTFMENPQFYVYVSEDTNITFLIQDALYETRMLKKQRNNTVYMGTAIFVADPELAKTGLKQLDFHGQMVDISKFTSNCENVLHCKLEARETPYILVPFTSQRGRQTEFALSAFGDKKIEMMPIPEQVGWVHTVLNGCWTEFTGRCGDGFEWRCNSQIRLQSTESCRVVFVLSYLSLDRERVHSREDELEERHNTRPRLHGRLFTSSFAPEKRYLKAFVPLPQGSTFVGSNAFSSNSYITTSATLSAGESYVFIPFTDTPIVDTWRLTVYCDSDEMEVTPMVGNQCEWHCTTFSGVWDGKPLSVSLTTTGKMVAVVNSPKTYLRMKLLNAKKKKLEGIESYWNSEASVEYVSKGAVTVHVEGMTRSGSKQEVAKGTKFDLFIFTSEACAINELDFKAVPSALPHPTKSTSGELLRYPQVVVDVDEPFAVDHSDDDAGNNCGDPLGSSESDSDDNDVDGNRGNSSDAQTDAVHAGPFKSPKSSTSQSEASQAQKAPSNATGTTNAQQRESNHNAGNAANSRTSAGSGLDAVRAASEMAGGKLTSSCVGTEALLQENRKLKCELAEREKRIDELERLLEGGSGGTKIGTNAPSAKGKKGVVGSVESGKQAADVSPAAAAAAAASAQESLKKEHKDIKRAIDTVVLRLNTIEGKDEPPATKEEWAKVQKDIREMQRKLFMARERLDSINGEVEVAAVGPKKKKT